MKRLLLALLAAAPLLHAQPLAFGEPFALANTRYGTTWGQPMIESNGSDFFVFWKSETNLRVAKLVEGESRPGRHVVQLADRHDTVSVTWTGTHFLLLVKSAGGVAGQLLDANAEPVGGTFPIVAGAQVGSAASNGETLLVLYWSSESVSAVALTPSGQPTGVSSVVAPPAGDGFSAVASNGSGFAAVVSGHAGTVAVTFDGDGREQSRTFLFTGAYPKMAGQVAIAGNGSGYFAAWQLWDGTVQGAHLAVDGSAGPVVDLAVPPPGQLFKDVMDVVWTGANWAVAYTDAASGDPLLRVAYVHPTAPQVTGYEDAGFGGQPSLAVANGQVVVLSWSPFGDVPAVASPLPLAGHAPQPVTFEAARQDAIAVASTADTTLVLWNEYSSGEDTLRAGVRSADGGWVEREIAPRSWYEALAATDGRGFLVTTRGQTTEPFAILLDAAGQVTAGPMPLPLRPESVTWTGTDYVIASGHLVARVSRGGTVGPTIPVSGLLALASNGSVMMAVTIVPEPCLECTSPVGRPRFALLGDDFRPVGEPRLIAPADAALTSTAELVWDGRRFVAAWEVEGKVTVAEVPHDGGEPRILATFAASIPWRLHLAAAEGGVAVAWRNGLQTTVAVIGHDDGVGSVVVDDGGHWINRGPFVTALPNGGIGLVASIPQYAAPHHGTPRVMMRVAGAALPARPEPPRLTGTVRDGRVELQWTAPPQPVAGYRLEYRIGDDAWNELEPWLDANDRAIALPWQLRERVPYQFRIRAFNDAGASPYSEAVTLNAPKRRSVR